MCAWQRRHKKSVFLNLFFFKYPDLDDKTPSPLTQRTVRCKVVPPPPPLPPLSQNTLVYVAAMRPIHP